MQHKHPLNARFDARFASRSREPTELISLSLQLALRRSRVGVPFIYKHTHITRRVAYVCVRLLSHLCKFWCAPCIVLSVCRVSKTQHKSQGKNGVSFLCAIIVCIYSVLFCDLADMLMILLILNPIKMCMKPTKCH